MWSEAKLTDHFAFMSKHEDDPARLGVDVLLLSTYDTDGAGKFTRQLEDSLCHLGYSTQVVCVRNRSGDDNTFGIIDRSPIRRLLYRLVEEVDRRLIRTKPDYAFIHHHALSDRVVLGSTVWPRRCKLIICTFLSGMMSPQALLALRSHYGDPPVVFYGVDMNFFTGGCHYSRDCIRYITDCSGCPAVPEFFREKVALDFYGKKEAFKKISPLLAIASSSGHHQDMLQSAVFSATDVRKILMAVDDRLYGKYESIRDQLKRERSCRGKVLLIRSSAEPRKGCDLFINAIRTIEKDTPEIMEDVTILAIGDQYIVDQLKDLGLDIYSPGYVAEDDELAKLYAVADVFLMTSLADGGPLMLAQSLMSGTRVISTDVGLARDLIHMPENGEILDAPSVFLLKSSILSFCARSDEKMLLARPKVREMALAQISRTVYLEKLASLMREVLDN